MSMDLNAIQAAVEQACIDFQTPGRQQQAEQVLLHFRQQYRPAVPAARHILQSSSNPDARFQATLVLKEAQVREWASLQEAERDELQSWLFQAVIHLASTGDGNANTHGLQASLCAALAVSIKRGWLDKPQDRRTTHLSEVLSVVSTCSRGVPAACAALLVLEAIVQEFSLATGSPLGQPFGYHEMCAYDLQDHHLQSIFGVACDIARQAASSGAVQTGQDGGVVAAACSLMATCLQWQYRKHGHASLHMSQAKQRASRDSVVGVSSQLSPGQAWAALLLDPNTSSWLVTLLSQLRQSYGTITTASTTARALSAPRSAGAAALAALPPATRTHVVQAALKGRALLQAFCSLSGDMFPRMGPEASVRHGFLVSVLQGVLPMFLPLDQAASAAAIFGYEGSELVDGIRCVCSLAPIHRAHALQAAGDEALSRLQIPAMQTPSGASGFMAAVEMLTSALIKLGGVNASGISCVDEGDDKYWQQEGTDMLLEAWCSLLSVDALMHWKPDGSHLPPGTTAAAAGVFRSMIDAALQDAARGAAEEVEDAAEAVEAVSLDDWMARAAVLARALPVHTLSYLAQAMTASQTALASAAACGADPSVPLEQLTWLVRMAAHCLADSGIGETPLLPLALLHGLELSPHNTPQNIQATSQAVISLSSALLGLTALVLAPQAQQALSPRLMEVCVTSLARWADTYLLPEESLPEELQVLYGTPQPVSQPGQTAGSDQQSCGGAVLSLAVQVANTCLVSYPGEAELHKQVVWVLLPALVRRKRVCEVLLNLPAWQQLGQAVSSRATGLIQGLGQKLHRGLAQALVLSAAGIHRTSAISVYIQQLLSKTVEEVSSLASRPDLSVVATRADVVQGACCLLETLRGASRGVLARTQSAIWSVATAPLLGPLLVLASAFKAHTQAVALILKLAAELVEAHVSYLQPADVEGLMRWVLALLQQYARDNTWAVKLSGSRAAQANTEAARDLKALLRLLGHVTQRDLVSPSTQGTHDHASGSMSTSSSSGHLSASTAANAHHNQPTMDSAQVVLTGLHILIPLMTPELLLFPKLPRLYFNLLSYCMETWPEQVAALNPEAFQQLISSLEWALSPAPTDLIVTNSALEGLAGLAKYQGSCMAAGQPGLSMHKTPDGKTVTQHFLELLLRRLMLGEWNSDLVEMAAEPLQPLITSEPQFYQAAAQALIASATIGGDKVAAALTTLGQECGIQPAPGGGSGKVNKRVFRDSLIQLVAEIRSLVCVR